MVIHLGGDNRFEIKTKTEVILTGPSVKIGSFTLTGQGEYEVADISARGYPGAYLFTAENITVLYVDNPNEVSSETLKQIEEDIDVLLIGVDANPEKTKKALSLVTEIDSKITIPTLNDANHPFCREVGGCQGPLDVLKVTPKDLDVDERKAVVLNGRSRAGR